MPPPISHPHPHPHPHQSRGHMDGHMGHKQQQQQQRHQARGGMLDQPWEKVSMADNPHHHPPAQQGFKKYVHFLHPFSYGSPTL